MNEICFASIDPLALRALPLEGEEIPATKCNYSRRLYFSPLPGEMPPLHRRSGYAKAKAAAEGFCMPG